MSKNIFTIQNGITLLNGNEILVKGLRCSNALLTDKTVYDLIDSLDLYRSYGLNTISVFLMGSRYGDIKGYHEDASLNPLYAQRLGKIIEAADDKGMIVLVGCLYWGTSKAKWESWTQAEANRAIENTVKWLKEKDYRNVFIDVDNEGMARKFAGFDTRELILAAKSVDESFMTGSNYKGFPPDEADLALHFSEKAPGKPYIESESSPNNAPGGYWAFYSRIRIKDEFYQEGEMRNYIRIGIYTEEMKKDLLEKTKAHLDNGMGFMLGSTWLQAVPPYGPNTLLGGYGGESDPGIRWWMEFVRDNYGYESYR